MWFRKPYMDALWFLIKNKDHSLPIRDYIVDGVLICPKCQKEYKRGVPRYCDDCKKLLRTKDNKTDVGSSIKE